MSLAGRQLPPSCHDESRCSRALARLDLPFEVPHPFGDAVAIDGRMAAAVSWVPGRPADTVNPAQVGALLASLRAAPLDVLMPSLGPPQGLGHSWPDVALREAVPLLPRGPRDEALRRIEAAAALPDVPPVLVHGDLGGDNVHWSSAGALVGVLDWDLAQPFDHAVDVACLATSYGWDAVSTVDAHTRARARIWARLFPVQQLVTAVLNGEPPEILEQFVLGVSSVLDGRAT